MDPRQLFYDDRFRGVCAYCGTAVDTAVDTADHVPSKVFLDKPYPPLLTVDACMTCNNNFSKDEPYLACLIECILHRTTDPSKLTRDKVKRILTKRPHFAREIGTGRQESLFGDVTWHPDLLRVENVVLKLARGHAAFEFSEQMLNPPDRLWIAPLIALSPEKRCRFEDHEPGSESVWPEIGSRAFVRAAKGIGVTRDDGWTHVQPGRYRYLAISGPEIIIRIVLSEYLACEISW